jgi:trimeric autotransporter adhesin
MGRFASRAISVGAVLACFFLTSCGSSNPTHVLPNEVPGRILIVPSPNVSLELGKTQTFTATASNGAGIGIAETFSYFSSNPAVVTVSNGGIACAGTWDSLTTPTVCTPGAAGVAQVSAQAQGISSPPVTVYVHQHVTSVTVSLVPGQPPTLSNLCLSKGAINGPESTLYQAAAFSQNVDVTGQVGPFTWQTVTNTGQTTPAFTLSSLPAGTPLCVSGGQGACLNQQKATANSPGISFFLASVDGVNSSPVPFTTCPVQSISISALSDPATSLVVPTSSSTTLNATVTDILGMTLTGVDLTWSSSNPIAANPAGATSTVFGSVGTVSAAGVGAAAITASCTPPTCNGGITPSLPIYPQQAISFVVEPAANATPASPTVYVTSTGCNPSENSTNQACTTRLVPITKAANTTSFAPGNPITLPFSPNSLLFDKRGLNAYLGVNSLAFGTQTSMSLNGSIVSPTPNVAGKILATSPDGTLAIFSDTADTPNQVFICQNCTSATANNQSAILFDGAVAAAVSPDNIAGGYKAYIVSGKPCPGTSSAGCLLVFSKVDGLKIVPLSAPATDAAFIGNGTFGYIAGGNSAGTAFLPTCDDPSVSSSIGSVPLVGQFVRALPDGQSAIALNIPAAGLPTLQTVTAIVTNPFAPNPPPNGVPGCPAPRGFLKIQNFVAPPFGLGPGNFTATQFFLSPDGSTGYILGQTGSGASAAILPFIISINLSTQTVFDISLSGNATPLSASISPAGDLVFVGADDGSIHIIDTTTQQDTQQVTFTFPQNSLCIGPGNPATAVESTMTITATTQTAGSTTFVYTNFSGPALQPGETIIVAGMTSPANNGKFSISAVSGSTFTVANANGVTLSGQNGTGTSGVICNPDVVAVKP